MKSFLNIIYSFLLVCFLLPGYGGPENSWGQGNRRDAGEVHAINTQARKVDIRGDAWDMSQPVHIEADRMLSDQKENVIVFTGNVVAVQGPLTINAREMTVYHESGSGEKVPGAKSGQGQQIDKIVATGEVQISRDDLTAAGDKVTFEIKGEKILITGNARVWHQDNLVKGEKVVFDLTEGTTVFESGGQEDKRVKAFFYPEEE